MQNTAVSPSRTSRATTARKGGLTLVAAAACASVIALPGNASADTPAQSSSNSSHQAHQSHQKHQKHVAHQKHVQHVIHQANQKAKNSSAQQSSVKEMAYSPSQSGQKTLSAHQKHVLHQKHVQQGQQSSGSSGLSAHQKHVAHQKHAQQGQQSSGGSSSSGSSASSNTSTPSGGSPKAIAKSMMSSSDFQCFSKIVERESGWNPKASNASSGAYGLVQALPASKMSSAGSDWKTNPKTQIKWGLDYMDSRYGSACGAWSFWQAHNWY